MVLRVAELGSSFFIFLSGGIGPGFCHIMVVVPLGTTSLLVAGIVSSVGYGVSVLVFKCGGCLCLGLGFSMRG